MLHHTMPAIAEDRMQAARDAAASGLPRPPRARDVLRRLVGRGPAPRRTYDDLTRAA